MHGKKKSKQHNKCVRSGVSYVVRLKHRINTHSRKRDEVHYHLKRQKNQVKLWGAAIQSMNPTGTSENHKSLLLDELFKTEGQRQPLTYIFIKYMDGSFPHMCPSLPRQCEHHSRFGLLFVSAATPG